jgi:hypothetical protein
MRQVVIPGVVALAAWALCVYPLLTWSPARIGGRQSGHGLAEDAGTGVWWILIATYGCVGAYFTYRAVRNLRGEARGEAL